MYVQQVLQTLNDFWAERGCILWQPYHTEVGAGTSNPATFLRVLGPEPWWVAYPEPSTRPADGRYGENPNRLQHYYQYQVILKPSPPNVQELFLQSFEALGLDLTKHDFRFVEDNWQSPSLGAWGLGWEAWLDGMEVLQFTYFQECGGVKLDVRACELTYGIERIAMYLQGVESVYDLQWAPSGITYGDIYHAQEVEFCKYNFDHSDADKLFEVFDIWEGEGLRLMDAGLVLPAYDHCLRLSHLFNLLDARGALSVTERGRFLLRCRVIAERCAKAYAAQREEMGHPLMRLPRPGAEDEGAPLTCDPASLNEKDTLLLEIGVEELPHKDVRTVLRQGPKLAEKFLADNGIEHGAIKFLVGPRRIALMMEDVPARQADVSKEMRGPKKAAAQDDAGNWTIPAQKFAEAQGATPDDIYFREEGKFEYCFVKVEQQGQQLTETLSTFVAQFLKAIPFGKSMGWEDSTVVFSRPVRWLLALHGSNAIPVSWKLRDKSDIGSERWVHSGTVSYGHRRLGPGQVEVPSADAYIETLKSAYVLVDRDKRMHALRSAVNGIVLENHLEADGDASLYEEICDLVEWPEPILCTIPEEALVLPEPIIITPMKVHQRYIPLRTPEGELSKHFLAVANGEHNAEGQDIIRVGNERVLNARLRDATYFWDTDTKTPLAEFAKGLERVTFHQKLGTVADKVARLKQLFVALQGSLPQVDAKYMELVLGLMKADLTTQMVGEFDSLEGLVGKLYAQKEGLPETVADAIFEHRLPRRAGDSMPEGALGIVAGILDRFDSLAGYFGVGMRPKGTSDPFALRRNALALLTIMRKAGIDADLAQLVTAAVDNYGNLIADKQDARDALLSFFKDRLSVIARDEGYQHDYVSAVIETHASRPAAFWACLRELGITDEDAVQGLAEQVKRMNRIAKEPAESLTEDLLDEQEKPFLVLLTDKSGSVTSALDQRDFRAAIDETASWVPTISAYFENVLVNDKDDKVRQNRHALVAQMSQYLTSQIADFSVIEKR